VMADISDGKGERTILQNIANETAVGAREIDCVGNRGGPR